MLVLLHSENIGVFKRAFLKVVTPGQAHNETGPWMLVVMLEFNTPAVTYPNWQFLKYNEYDPKSYLMLRQESSSSFSTQL